MKRMAGGIYLFRTNKPYAILGVPLLGRHNGYVGQSKVYRLRWGQHVAGGGKYKNVAKLWSDLDPEPWRILPLPAWLFLRAPWAVDSLEALCILLTAPVYNVQLNGWNPRRIPPARLRRQRAWRDRAPLLLRISVLLLRLLVKLQLLVFVYLIWKALQ